MMNPSQPNFGPGKRTWGKNRSRNGKRFTSQRMIGILKDVEKSQALRRWPMGSRNSVDNRRKDGTNKPLKHTTNIPVSSKVTLAETSKTLKRKNISIVGECSKGVARSYDKFSHAEASIDKSNCASALGAGKLNRNLASAGKNKRIDGHLVKHRNEKRRNEERKQCFQSKFMKNSLPNGKDPSAKDCDEECIRGRSHRMLSSKHIANNQLEGKFVGCLQQRRIRKALLGADDNDSDKSTRKRVAPMQQKCKPNDVSDASENLTSKNWMPQNKRRKHIEANEDESDIDNQNVACGDDGVFGVCIPTASEALKRQSLLPTYEPIWSGIFKIDGKKYVPLAGHLSTKSSKSVRMLSRSLLPVVKVTKHSWLEVWPMSSEVSGPTDENIHMFLFPHSMRLDKNVDQLVKEVMENDLALRAVVGEAEMLIFPSIILPKQYQTFKGRHYLWGMFRPKKDIVGLAAEQQSRTMPTENQEGFEGFSEQDKAGHVPEPNKVTELEDPEGAKMKDAVDQNLTPTQGGSNASRANEPPVAGTVPTNHEEINSRSGVPSGMNMMFAFIAQPSPRIEQLMKEMEREGAVVLAMPTMTTGPGLGQATAATE